MIEISYLYQQQSLSISYHPNISQPSSGSLVVSLRSHWRPDEEDRALPDGPPKNGAPVPDRGVQQAEEAGPPCGLAGGCFGAAWILDDFWQLVDVGWWWLEVWSFFSSVFLWQFWLFPYSLISFDIVLWHLWPRSSEHVRKITLCRQHPPATGDRYSLGCGSAPCHDLGLTCTATGKSWC